jgi:hypothetical protein
MSHDDRKRAIGKVVSVAADRFVVEMHAGTDNFTVVGFDDVHYVARLGSFLMIPAQSEYVVVEVVGLRERDASTPSERGDFDRAGSSKYLDVVPVGMLPMRGGAFRFGVSVFPSLYADALYALDGELDRIFETEAAVEPSVGPDGGACQPEGATRYRVLPIGKSVVFEDYDVKVRLNEFFGGHVAVLGNTGSGKSCTVASVLQSLFDKPDEHHARGATFIVFDVNGEYHEALAPLAKDGGIGVHRVILDGTTAGFRMPHWFLEMAEWELLLQASERTQLPVLRTALGLTSLLHANTPDALALREHFVATCIIECFRGADGDSPVSKFQRVVSLLQKYPTNDLNMALLNRFNPNFQYGNFSGNNQSAFLDEVRKKLREDAPLPAYSRTPFSFDELHECLDFAILYEEAHGNRQIRDYCSSMVTRLRSLQERTEYAFLRHEGPDVGAAVSDLEFLTNIVGLERAAGEAFTKRNQVIIIDLNSVEDEIVELVSAVIARMLFGSFAMRNQKPLPDTPAARRGPQVCRLYAIPLFHRRHKDIRAHRKGRAQVRHVRDLGLPAPERAVKDGSQPVLQLSGSPYPESRRSLPNSSDDTVHFRIGPETVAIIASAARAGVRNLGQSPDDIQSAGGITAAAQRRYRRGRFVVPRGRSSR